MATASTTGLKTLPPMPPKICLPMTTAMKVPVRTAHHGMVAGTSMANRRPMSAALPSPMVMVCLVTLLMASSQPMAEETDNAATAMAGAP